MSSGERERTGYLSRSAGDTEFLCKFKRLLFKYLSLFIKIYKVKLTNLSSADGPASPGLISSRWRS